MITSRMKEEKVFQADEEARAGPALARIGGLHDAAEELITARDARLRQALRLIHAAVTIAATEPLPAQP
jgi:hypothetical protein